MNNVIVPPPKDFSYDEKVLWYLNRILDKKNTAVVTIDDFGPMAQAYRIFYRAILKGRKDNTKIPKHYL